MEEQKNTKPKFTFKGIVPLLFSLIIGVLLAIFFIPNKEQLLHLFNNAGGKLLTIFHQLAYYLGAALLILSPFYLHYRFKYGKDWASKVGIKLVAGKGLMASTKKLVNEVQTSQLQTDTVVEVGVNIFWRFTRIGLIGLSLAIIPIWLLVNQNELLKQQNQKFDIQNERINLQNNLVEADRRGSLVLLMSNIIDQVNAEIEKQKPKNPEADTLPYKLSDPLIGRIAALSQSLLPYRYLVADTLSEREVSFERGQLLLALVNSKLDLITMNKIYAKTNFSFSYLLGADLEGTFLENANLAGASLEKADLVGANLQGADLSRANLQEANLIKASLREADLGEANLIKAILAEAILVEADLRDAKLYKAYMKGAKLKSANLSWANLKEANLKGVNLKNATLQEAILERAILEWADLQKTNLQGAQWLELKQLKSTISLYKCKGIEKFMPQLKKEKPCLFIAPEDSYLNLRYPCLE